MQKVSKKRQAMLRAYNKAKQAVEQELRDSGKWVCIFTGQPIPDHLSWREVNWHHLKGRDGDLMTDKKFIRPYMDENAHTGDYGYHSKPLSVVKTYWWWEGFINRVQQIDHDLWYSLTLKGLTEQN